MGTTLFCFIYAGGCLLCRRKRYENIPGQGRNVLLLTAGEEGERTNRPLNAVAAICITGKGIAKRGFTIFLVIFELSCGFSVMQQKKDPLSVCEVIYVQSCFFDTFSIGQWLLRCAKKVSFSSSY